MKLDGLRWAAMVNQAIVGRRISFLDHFGVERLGTVLSRTPWRPCMMTVQTWERTSWFNSRNRFGVFADQVTGVEE